MPGRYTTVQSIREAAGMLKRKENERLSGAVDGVNKTYTTARGPLVDHDHDDEVTVSDVRAYVDGVSVEVASVNAENHTIEVESAPAVGAKVTADYWFSPLTEDYVDGKVAEADSWVELKIKSSKAFELGYIKLPLNAVPGALNTAAELYGAGLVLTRDYGNHTDTSLTSKDGYQKLTTARSIINEYLEGVYSEGKANRITTNNTAAVITNEDVFDREYDPGYGYPLDDDLFMRRQ